MSWIIVAVLIVLLGVMSVMLVHALFLLIAAFSFAPYVSSGRRIAEVMARLSGATRGTVCAELGSGNGEIALRVAERGADIVGYEINPVLVWWSRMRARHRKLAERAQFVRANMWHTKLPYHTTVVFIYSLPGTMERIWQKVERECGPGTVIVSHAFMFPGKTPIAAEGAVRVYRVDSSTESRS